MARFSIEALATATNNSLSIADMADDLGPFFPAAASTPVTRRATNEQTHTTHASDDDGALGEMRGRLTTCAAITMFVTAGKATLTILSKKSGTRFTLKFVRPMPEPGRQRPIWVKLLNGPDNEGSYAFLGTVWEQANGFSYRHSAKSPMSQNTPSVAAVLWLLKCLNLGADDKLAQCEVWHEGRCGRCGRKLTVPSSIASGFGPECINHV